MDTNKHIAKALLNKSFAEAKELVFKSLYAKASLALDEARFAVANGVFNEAKTAPDTGVPAGAMKEEAELGEMAQTAARYKETLKASEKTWKAYQNAKNAYEKADKTHQGEQYSNKLYGKGGKILKKKRNMKEEAELDEMAQTADRASEMKTKVDAASDRWYNAVLSKPYKGKRKDIADANKKLAKVANQNRKEADDKKKLYGRGGKVVGKITPVKEAAEQLDEVSPPDMEKMTGSKHTKASFAKQYGKRGKSVMYATAWKLHNKKAGIKEGTEGEELKDLTNDAMKKKTQKTKVGSNKAASKIAYDSDGY
jgi:hypothetical protein